MATLEAVMAEAEQRGTQHGAKEAKRGHSQE